MAILKFQDENNNFIPVVQDVKVNGTSVFDGKDANVTTPTKTSELTNDSGFIDNTYHDNTKQDTLVSGTNIKTVNNQSLLGSGNITIESGAGSYPDLPNKPKINNVELVGNKSLNDLGIQPQGNYASIEEIPIYTSQLINDSGFGYDVDIPDRLSQLTDDTTHRLVTDTEKSTWNGKQEALVSGTNIKTINNESILGSGNIVISSGSSDYTQLTNNPVTLRNDTGNVALYTLVPAEGRISYQFLNGVTITAPTANGTLTIQLAPGNTVTMSTEEVSLVCPGGNYYIYPDETPITGQTTWSGGYCPTYDDVETMILDAGGWEVQTNATATGTVTMEKGQMFKKTRATGVTRLTIKFPDEIDDNYKSRLVLNTASSFSSFTITEPDYDVYFYGDDCANGVITGVAGKYYDMTARADGFGNVLIEVFAKENS